ncbi:MAG: NRDE family protein [Pseudomonadota bacterium]
MCLALLAVDTHPRYRLIVGANRDEFYDRPTAPAAPWADAPQVLAGRDLQAGGTWLGVTAAGRIALVTNYREGRRPPPGAPSRGRLVADYLRGDERPETYVERIARDDLAYPGYNLIVGDRDALIYHSNRGGETRALGPGVYGLSNHLLDTPWPKVALSKAGLFQLLDRDGEALAAGLLELLADRSRPQDHELPETGIGLEWERLLGSAFIASPTYGTRSSTVLLVARSGEITFVEQTFGAEGVRLGRVSHRLPAPAPPARSAAG